MAYKKVLILLIIGALIVFTGLGSYYFYHYQKQENAPSTEEIRKSKKYRYIKLSKGWVRYELKNPDTTQTIVLLCGAGAGIELWEKVAGRLEEKGYRTLTFDYYGRGFSDRIKGEYTTELFTGQLREILDSLKITQPIHLTAFSMGAIPAIDYSIQKPDKIASLIFLNPAILNPKLKWYFKNSFLADYLITAYWMPNSIEKQMSEFEHAELFPEFKSCLIEQRNVAGYKRAITSVWRNILSENKKEDLTILNNLDFPKLLIMSKNDQRVLYRQNKILRSCLSNASFSTAENCGHLAAYENPEDVTLFIQNFLDSLPKK